MSCGIEDLAGLWAMLEEVPNPGRRVPVPRRMIRRLAGGLSKARTATVIAHLIRCLFYRKGQGINAIGCCKASWVAEVFGVTERSVYDARKYLIEEFGWLVPGDCAQHVLNRDGLWVTINLAWGSDPALGSECSRRKVETDRRRPNPRQGRGARPPRSDPSNFHPLRPKPRGIFQALRKTRNPFGRIKTRNPPPADPLGFNSKSEENPPKLADMVPEDLRESRPAPQAVRAGHRPRAHRCQRGGPAEVRRRGGPCPGGRLEPVSAVRLARGRGALGGDHPGGRG